MWHYGPTSQLDFPPAGFTREWPAFEVARKQNSEQQDQFEQLVPDLSKISILSKTLALETSMKETLEYLDEQTSLLMSRVPKIMGERVSWASCLPSSAKKALEMDDLDEAYTTVQDFSSWPWNVRILRSKTVVY